MKTRTSSMMMGAVRAMGAVGVLAVACALAIVWGVAIGWGVAAMQVQTTTAAAEQPATADVLVGQALHQKQY